METMLSLWSNLQLLPVSSEDWERICLLFATCGAIAYYTDFKALERSQKYPRETRFSRVAALCYLGVGLTGALLSIGAAVWD
ncbi:MAG: hypothetical protein K6T31_11300 [Alicyclobacillus sp.]|nr:hypothetical protein [Alicyclobacillus sp.]